MSNVRDWLLIVGEGGLQNGGERGKSSFSLTRGAKVLAMVKGVR